MKAIRYERRLREWLAREGMGWERWSSDDPGGRTLRYRMGPRRPRGSVLLVHGAGNDALFSMSGLIKGFIGRGLEVFAFDLPGHGRASTTVLDADAARSAIPRAMQEAGLDGGVRPHLVGMSFGGALALHALAAAPDAFAASAVVSTPLRIVLTRATVGAELRPRLLGALWRARRDGGVWGAVPAFGPVKRAAYPLRLSVDPPPGPFGYVHVLNGILGELEVERMIGRIRCPLLVAHGERDRIAPIEQAERIVDAAPRAELQRLPRDGHLTALATAIPRIVDHIASHAGTGAR